MRLSQLLRSMTTVVMLGWLSHHAAIYAAIVDSTVTTKQNDNANLSAKKGRVWNLQDADILSVINEVSQETGKNFIVDPRVSGKISLISSKPIPEKDLYQVFLSILGILNYSVIANGNVLKIVPNMDSSEQATPVATRTKPGKGEEVVVRIIPLESVSAAQLLPIVRVLMPQWSNVSAYTPGNVLILFGRASNLERMAEIIQQVDRATNSTIEMITLKRANAPQVALVLTNLQNTARMSGDMPGISIATDERSNSILLSGPKAARLKMRLIIAQLDAPASAPAGNTDVIYLRYLEAKTLAPILSKVAQNILGKDSGGSSSTPAGSSSSQGGTISNAQASAATNIQAEISTNAIIITAPPSLMRALKAVVTKLDIRPAQVLVEAIIAEVSESDMKSLGIQWGSTAPSSSNSNGNQTESGPLPTSFPTLGAGIYGIIHGKHYSAVLSALENMNGVNILSTPSVVVLDNQKGFIEVGQDVPTLSGSYANSNNTGTVNPFNTISNKTVSLRLDVSPQINLRESVRLNIKLKNDSLQNPSNPTLTPLINTSKIENSVLINTEDILVVGGLVTNNTNENTNKVPILGDIPIIGHIFQQKSQSLAKRNLVVFIKPSIIYTPENSLTMTEMKYNMIRHTQATFRDDLNDIGKTQLNTILPPWKATNELPKPFNEQ
jgi:general secretion pathway protein D